MKRVKIAAVLLVLIIAGSVSSLFILKEQNDMLTARITDIRRVYVSGDREGAAALSRELEDIWKDYERRVTVLIHDDALTDINISVARLAPLTEGDSAEFDAEISSLIRQLDRLFREEVPYWYNIL